MTEQTRARIERAAPAQWIERLEIFRERFRLGLINETRFNEIARAFQLKDDLGHIWMPGATSNQWYRWDRTQWRVATPHSQLSASEMPIAISFAWDRPIPAPPAPPIPTKNQVALSVPPSVDAPPAPPIPIKNQVALDAPPTRVPTRPRPTDLPERGATRSRAKPTDLPR